MVRAARCLLAAVTQVLLLADTVVVKQLLQAKDKVLSMPVPPHTIITYQSAYIDRSIDGFTDWSS